MAQTGRTARGGAIAVAAAAAAAIGLLGGCSGSSTSTASAAASSSPATASASATAAASTASAAASASGAASATGSASASAAVAFVPITEVFDPGHPAAAKSSPSSCSGQSTTIAIEQCLEDKTETQDAAIDTVRQASFASASAAQQAAINSADSAWLSARKTVCSAAYQTGGTIDGINIGSCLLDESTARLDALKGISPAEAVLQSTDDTSLSDLDYYTTPEGSRIGLMDTQGDATGGVIIAWVIIAGADGFTVNPAQFTYRDGTFTDAGIVQGANPDGHKVAPGTQYQFSIDYSRLSADPNKGKDGGYVYAPVTPVAVWR